VETAPSLTVTRVTCGAIGGGVQHPGDAVRWVVTWALCNSGPSFLELTDAWIPHGRFRGDGRISLAVAIAPGATHSQQFFVSADEAPGTVVENAFLILRVSIQGAAWRVFIRMRIAFDASAVPQPAVETITTHSLE